MAELSDRRAPKPRHNGCSPKNLRGEVGVKKYLERLRKGDSRKIKIATRLRQETTMTWEWIAENLRMGAAGDAAKRVREQKE